MKKKLPGLLFFSDFEKAFDTINHDFIVDCLHHFNFGNSFINWIKLFYNDIKSIMIHNGYLSEPFPVQRGVRQGCPLSSFLFVICIEILSNFIAHDNLIEGITVNQKEIKQSLFTDDATFM